MPQISVIVPVYNVEKYLHRCVDSILAQTFTDFELILVDDGSPDNCGVICDEYTRKDSRVHVIHQANCGVAVARNSGIDWVFEKNESRWISFVDSDDWIHPQYLEILLQAAIESQKEISMCMFIETDIEAPIENQRLSLKIVNPGDAYTYNSKSIDAYPWGRLYAKDCFRDIRYPAGRTWEDLATTYKLLYAQNEIAVAENVLYFYYIRGDSIVRTKWNRGKLDYLFACEEQIPFLDKHGENSVADQLKLCYMKNIAMNYDQARKSELSESEKRKICLDMRRKMRSALIKYRKSASVSVKNRPWFYEIAFPRFMYVYWFTKAQLDKIIKTKVKRV